MQESHEDTRPLKVPVAIQRRARPATIALALLILVCVVAGGVAGAQAFLPVAPGANRQVSFEVQSGDTARTVGDRLEKAGLIRSASAFAVLARAHGLELKQGTYTLSPGMSADTIIRTLQRAPSVPQVVVQLAPGLRVLEYPPLFADLTKFDKDSFLKIATTGKYPDGTSVAEKYWFVPPPQPNAKFALEGYLYPDTYSFDATANEVAVVNRLLDAFGQHLCPGPKGSPSAYFHDRSACVAHAAQVGPDGKKTALFEALRRSYFTADDVQALYRGLTLASIVMRESGGERDHIVVTNVLYNRYAVSQRKLPPPTTAEPLDTFNVLGADATAWYARDTDTPPADGIYWKDRGQRASRVAVNNPYNTNVATHKGLTPGPISAPYFTYLDAAATPNADGATPYFFYLHDSCDPPRIHTAVTYAQHLQNITKYIGKCPAS